MSMQKGNHLVTEIQRRDRDKLLIEFQKFSFSSEIISEARKIWQEIGVGVQKQKKRIMLLFFCFYVAHIRLKVVQDYEYISQKVNLNPKDAIRSFIEFSESKTGFRVPLIEFKISDFLNIYLHRLGLSDDETEIFDIYKQLCCAPDSLQKRKLLRVTKPQNVAAAILDYYKSQKYARMKVEEYSLLFKKKETIHTVKSTLIELLHHD